MGVLTKEVPVPKVCCEISSRIRIVLRQSFTLNTVCFNSPYGTFWNSFGILERNLMKPFGTFGFYVELCRTKISNFFFDILEILWNFKKKEY